jgi:hypothetical protein
MATGVVTTLAGSGAAGEVDGTGTQAQFNVPFVIAIDLWDNLYVADNTGNTIRKIDLSTGSAVVTTVAGSGGTGDANGTGTAATFNTPNGIVWSLDILYIADGGNNKVRQIQ